MKLVVFFDDGGRPRHAAFPECLNDNSRLFACQVQFPDWWEPKPKKLVDADRVELKCKVCEKVRKSLVAVGDYSEMD